MKVLYSKLKILPGWPANLTHSVIIDAFVYTGDKQRKLSGLNSDGRSVPESLRLNIDK